MDPLNRWLSLLANVGVIAGIVFLAVEIRQNNVLMTASAYQARSNDLMQMSAMVAESEVLSSALTKSRLNLCDADRFSLDGLSGQERTVLRQYLAAQLFRLQNLDQQYQHGLLDDEYHQGAVLGTIQLYMPIWRSAGLPQSRLGQQILDAHPGKARNFLRNEHAG